MRMINTKIFSISKKMEKLYCIFCSKYREFEKPKIYLFIVYSIVCSKCKNQMKKHLKKKN